MVGNPSFTPVNNFGLTNKEIIELRLKCLAPLIAVASKANIGDDVVMKKAEVAWEYAVALLVDTGKKIPDESQTSKDKTTTAKK